MCRYGNAIEVNDAKHNNIDAVIMLLKNSIATLEDLKSKGITDVEEYTFLIGDTRIGWIAEVEGGNDGNEEEN